MKAAAFLAKVAALPVGTLTDITRDGGLVVVAPHPDDESLGCAGLIAAACAARVDVRLIVVSDGIGSHPHSPSYPPERLRTLREEETRCAVSEIGLGAGAISFLRLPDRAVPTRGADAEAAMAAILSVVREVHAVSICVTWHHDPHCDHKASATLVEVAAARAGLRVWYYPVWGWTLPGDTDVGAPPKGLRFDISRHRAAKSKAIFAHRSQTTNLIDDDPKGFRLQPDLISHFLGDFEFFLEGEPQ